MRLTPHPAFVAQITARRGERDHASALPTLDAVATWKTIQKQTIENKRYDIHERAKNDEHLRRAMEMIKAGKLPEPFDSATVAIAERIVPRGYQGEITQTLVRVVAEARGVAEMVAVKLASIAIAVRRDGRSALELDAVDSPFIGNHDVAWDVARAIVCHSDEASYAAARKVAESWRATRPVKLRMAAAFIFPAETAWANADFDELLKLAATDPYVFHAMYPLLSAVTDEARVTSMIDTILTSGNTWQLHNMMKQAACEIAASLPPDGALRVLKLLLAKGARGAGKTEVALLGQAMASLEGEEMAAELAGLLLHPAIGPIAVEYFRRFPELAKTVLPKVASGTSKAADAARSILAAKAGKDDTTPLAEGDEVPTVLRDTPWRNRKKPKAVTLGELPPPPAIVIEWTSDEEKANALEGKGSWYAQHGLQDMGAEALVEWQNLKPDHRPVDMWMHWNRSISTRTDYRVPKERGLREWNENAHAPTYIGPLHVLAVHGDAAVPGLFKRDAFALQWSADPLFLAQLHAVSAESARIAAAALVRRKGWRKIAQEWIAAHASVVAQSLLPIALGKDSKERKEAEAAVRFAARGHRDAVLEAAKKLGADAEHATHELVDRDPLTDLDVKGKLPPFVRVEDLPPLKTKTGKRLPDDAVIAMLEILRSTSPDLPYAGLDAIRDELDEASLGDFAWALVQAWILAGAKGTFEWVPLSLSLIGDDSCARRLAPYVRDWARKDAKKAKMCVNVLAAMGSSTALLHLSYVADKSRFEEAKTFAKETLERVAAAQGLTTDELADRTVPDLELDKDGTATLDFGPRKFTVTFDEGLHPVLKGEDGARIPTFPRGTKTDDSAKVKLASARYKGLKADAEAVVQTLLRRFEQAMIHGRTWHKDAFRTYVIEHPLVTHLARRLVWSVGKKAFRVADDGTLADASDAALTLNDGETITLPHPLTLGKDAVNAWSRVVSDYAMVQPFEQLGRATYTLSEAELTSSKLERYEGKTSKPGPLMGSLEARGWQKWPDETSLSSCGKKVRTKSGGEAQVSLGFQPGIELSDVANAPDQVLRAPQLSGSASWAALDPIDVSELVRDMEFIAH